MNTAKEHPRKPRQVIHVVAVPEDEATQEELNRTHRKPGEPGYIPPAARKANQEQQPGTKDSDRK